MEILQKIESLKKTIKIVDDLADELTVAIDAKNLKIENQESKLASLKDDIRSNILQIDEIIKEHNANTKS